MRVRIRDILIFIAGGAIVNLLLAKPFLSAEWNQPINFAILAIFAALIAMALVINKLTRGVYFPPPTPEAAERLRIRREQTDTKFRIYLYLFASTILSIPVVAALRHFG
jgi:hypothetical protein